LTPDQVIQVVGGSWKYRFCDKPRGSDSQRRGGPDHAVQPGRPPIAAGSAHFGQGEWDIAIELCDRAVDIIRGAGADNDEFARRRVLAAIEHTVQLDTLGAIAGFAEKSTSDLVEELGRIQREEDGRQGQPHRKTRTTAPQRGRGATATLAGSPIRQMLGQPVLRLVQDSSLITCSLEST
jgi:hypothetical protein